MERTRPAPSYSHYSRWCSDDGRRGLLPTSVYFIPFLSCFSFQSTSFRHKMCLLFLSFLLHAVPGAEGVYVHNVRGPDYAIVGQPVKLECIWETRDTDFYSIRWYINGEQFYSFIRGNTPDKVDHGLRGIKVALSYSDQNVVTISEVTPATEGMYRCEVMSEAPFFQTSFASRNLTVVDMPDDPELIGVREVYRVGDTLNVSCTARDARPPAKIIFELNGEIPESRFLTRVNVFEGSVHGVHTSIRWLVIPVSSKYLETLVVKCSAVVSTVNVETSIVTHVEPRRTTLISFFNAGDKPSSGYPIFSFLVAAFLALFGYPL